MRHRAAWGLAVLAVTLSGCLSDSAGKPNAWLDRFQQCGPVGSDVSAVEVALLERPVGDDYLDRGVWSAADEQVIPAESRSTLEDNGVRVGRVGGLIPVELQELLTSDRSCVRANRHVRRSNDPIPVTLGPVLPDCEIDLAADGKPAAKPFRDAQFLLLVTPTPTEDGRVRLHFRPQARHGERRLLPQLSANGADWSLQGRQATESFAGVEWEVTLSPGEYVLVGTRSRRPRTLGHRLFTDATGANPVQHVLAVRAGRCDAEPAGEPSASLARQAAGR